MCLNGFKSFDMLVFGFLLLGFQLKCPFRVVSLKTQAKETGLFHSDWGRNWEPVSTHILITERDRIQTAIDNQNKLWRIKLIITMFSETKTCRDPDRLIHRKWQRGNTEGNCRVMEVTSLVQKVWCTCELYKGTVKCQSWQTCIQTDPQNQCAIFSCSLVALHQTLLWNNLSVR